MTAKKTTVVKTTAQLSKALKTTTVKVEPQPKAPPAPKLPKSLAACVDLLYTTQQARYALTKEADKLSAIEVAIRERLIQELPKSDSTGLAGKVARANIEVKAIVRVSDKDKLRKFADAQIKKYPEQRETWYRFVTSEASIKELWGKGKAVPGAERMQVPVVSLHKV